MGKHARKLIQYEKHANPTQMYSTQGHSGPEKGQELLLCMGKVLGTPDMPEEVGLSRPIISFVANVGYSCRLMYAEGNKQHALKT